MITTAEAAKMLGVSQRRARALIESGALRARKLGHTWAVDESSVRERANSERLRGRPSATKAASGLPRYTLMSHNHEVLSFSYKPQTKTVSDLQPLAGIDWKPLGIGRHDKAPNRYDLAEWIRNRAIPTVRPNVALLLRDLRMGSPSDLLFASWGLSLSDSYWFRPEGSNATWEEVNFYDNGYAEAFGDLMLDGGASQGPNAPSNDVGPLTSSDQKTALTHSPDSATDGMLAKTWVRRRGVDHLIKGGTGNENREPFNEALASRLLKRLLEPGEFVCYEVVDRKGRAYSSCANITSPATELIPAHDVLTAFGVSEGRDLHRGYLQALAHLEVPHAQQLIDKMIVVDHLMANFDRHTRNFGLLRTVESRGDYRIAPLFDHGCGFYSRATTAELEQRPYAWESHPFREYPSQQLALVQDISWYEPSALDGFMDDIAEVLGNNAEIDERFIAAVQRQTARQIETVNNLAAERGLVVPGW